MSNHTDRARRIERILRGSKLNPTNMRRIDRLLAERFVSIDEFCDLAGIPFETQGLAREVLKALRWKKNPDFGDFVSCIFTELLARELKR